MIEKNIFRPLPILKKSGAPAGKPLLLSLFSKKPLFLFRFLSFQLLKNN